MAELEKAIADWIEHHNEYPSAFTWTAKVEDVLTKVDRARRTLQKTASQ